MGAFRYFKNGIKKALRFPSQIYYTISGSKVECNICHYKTNLFESDSWHLYTICQNCSSSVRQRLLIASLTHLKQLNFNKIINSKSILHFAPEKAIGKIMNMKTNKYKTADFFAEGYSYDHIDYNIDISDMPSIQNESFDCVIACDVLEHVPDHISAMKEVNRVLKPGGYCIFTVPQKDGLKITFEDLTITDKKERERVFGQFDHLRIYGDDFSALLEKTGFDITEVDQSCFVESIVDRHVLFPPILSDNPLATNYRKVFFGKKRE